jgi:predicted alpha/beta-fold hydrolase
MNPSAFRPPRFLRNPHVQSMLASSNLRRWLYRDRHAFVMRNAVEHILDCGESIRLQGFHSTQNVRDVSLGLVVLLHGWEGSAQSGYILNVAFHLLQNGYDVFRLNFRDHGNTHHLNREIFHSCRIQEVVAAVKNIASTYNQQRLCVAGFSLGGNFALRVGLHAPSAGIPLHKIIAVCPAIRPHGVLEAMEKRPRLYHAYFMSRWRSSLKRKQILFPDDLSLDDRVLKLSMRDLTSELIIRYTEFDSLDAYLDGYSLHCDRLSTLSIPTAILTAKDDPIIPIADFHHLQLPANVKLDIARFGGHCGFLRDWSLRSYAEDYLLSQLDDNTTNLNSALQQSNISDR